MLTAVLAALGFMAVVMAGAYFYQRALKNSGWVDVFWTYGSGACAVAAALSPGEGTNPPRQWLTAALAGIWALRLGTYVAIRVASTLAEDARYQAFRERWGPSYERNLFWLVMAQPPVSAVLVLAVALAAHAPGPLSWRDGVALLVMILAVGGESLADRQLTAFKHTGHAKGAICDTGLWGWSRHPNYFFEWLGWWAYPLIAIDPARPLSWASLGAPLIMYLVLRLGTGVPPLEASMLKSRGDAFRAYQTRVSVFFPLPPKPKHGAAA